MGVLIRENVIDITLEEKNNNGDNIYYIINVLYYMYTSINHLNKFTDSFLDSVQVVSPSPVAHFNTRFEGECIKRNPAQS